MVFEAGAPLTMVPLEVRKALRLPHKPYIFPGARAQSGPSHFWDLPCAGHAHRPSYTGAFAAHLPGRWVGEGCSGLYAISVADPGFADFFRRHLQGKLKRCFPCHLPFYLPLK